MTHPPLPLPQRSPLPGKLTVQACARIAGLLYLVIIVVGVVGESLIRGSLVAPGDPGATARNIMNAESLWRFGIAAQDLLLVCALGLTFMWYVLLRPVNRQLTWLAVFFALTSLAVESVSALHLHAVLVPLSDAAYLKTVDPQLLHLQAYQSVVAHAQAFGLALVFFGVECIVIGHLVRRSGYFPKLIGTLMQVAGVCYLVNSFAMILSPPLQGLLFPFILLPCLIGESAFCLYLLIKGIRVPVWERHPGLA
jgi:hypothetical protein